MSKTLTKRASLLRGVVISAVIDIERLIDIYLADYFSVNQDKRHELLDLVLSASGGMAAEPKRVIFAALFMKHNRKFYEDNKDFFEHLTFIIKQRNILAHYLLDRSEHAVKRFKETGDIGFVKFKKVRETTWFTNQETNELYNKLNTCLATMKEIVPDLKNW